MKAALAILSAIVVGLLGAANATADPQDLVPYCSGDQTPMDSGCRTPPSQVITGEKSGLSPNLPSGLTPLDEPVI